MVKIKLLFLIFIASFFLINCGYKADPSALFPTFKTTVEEEVERRKSETALKNQVEKNINEDSNNLKNKIENKDKNI